MTKGWSRPRRLPGVRFAIIEERKVTQYLLAAGHPAGRGKAAFFRRFGFHSASWQSLRDALLKHARSAQVAGLSETEFGKKYILEGPLAAADGRRPRIVAVWFVTAGEKAPRLVTAYPVHGVDQ
jgi:hypothetical protein